MNYKCTFQMNQNDNKLGVMNEKHSTNNMTQRNLVLKNGKKYHQLFLLSERKFTYVPNIVFMMKYIFKQCFCEIWSCCIFGEVDSGQIDERSIWR